MTLHQQPRYLVKPTRTYVATALSVRRLTKKLEAGHQNFEVLYSALCLLASTGGAVTILVAEDPLAEVSDHEGKTVTEGDLRLPPEELLGFSDVWLALVRVVLSVLTELNPRIWVDGVLDNLGQLQHGELTRVTQVERSNVLPFHQLHQTLNLEEDKE
jgi:hypothetical protein